MRHRRLTAWLVVFALVVGTLLPAHVGAHAWQADAMGRDFCTTTGKTGAPPVPDRAHADACASCYVCGNATAAPGTPYRAAALVRGGWLDVVVATWPTATTGHAHALARGPPSAA